MCILNPLFADINSLPLPRLKFSDVKPVEIKDHKLERVLKHLCASASETHPVLHKYGLILFELSFFQGMFP